MMMHSKTSSTIGFLCDETLSFPISGLYFVVRLSRSRWPNDRRARLNEMSPGTPTSGLGLIWKTTTTFHGHSTRCRQGGRRTNAEIKPTYRHVAACRQTLLSKISIALSLSPTLDHTSHPPPIPSIIHHHECRRCPSSQATTRP